MALVRLNNVTLQYPIYSPQSQSVRAHLFSTLGGRIDSSHRVRVVQALRDVSFELNDGDSLGLVGHNGAGKTTMLRLISGIYEPTVGQVTVQGKLSTYVDITLGMDPEASGWDNIILRAAFLGLTFAEARAKSPEIAEFSELGEFLDMPVRTYSAGMFMRLAFAVTTTVQPEIMVMDEMIGAGDAAFLEKAMARARSLLAKTKIVVLATHSTDIMRLFCNKAAWLEKGQLVSFGPIDQVLEQYQRAVQGQK